MGHVHPLLYKSLCLWLYKSSSTYPMVKSYFLVMPCCYSCTVLPCVLCVSSYWCAEARSQWAVNNRFRGIVKGHVWCGLGVTLGPAMCQCNVGHCFWLLDKNAKKKCHHCQDHVKVSLCHFII